MFFPNRMSLANITVTTIIVTTFLGIPAMASWGYPVEMAAGIVFALLGCRLLWVLCPVEFPAYFPFAVLFAVFLVRFCSFAFFGIPLQR